ncbi:MAG: hypothetical protein PHE06_04700 [Lachnospiraceae bacterium]|nr:hypothetical protein [Lachnospiraceae bacterium]
MDKNEYNLKLEEIDRYVNQGNYSEAAKVADVIDWRRVRNVRTLCMVSEIYEADNRFEDSKALLLRAYRRSPVGRAILYRLVEVTIHLKQFDEAIEYYSEYVQAAPHDNNKYILKYKIYRGRGSSLEEQIDILKEYLSQEYTEKWAYELARLYQQADRIQDCLTACDDLVLWFHNGKYVIKALELKKKYAPLTPKQQEIYEHRFEEPAEDEEEITDETALGGEKRIIDTSEDELAENIISDTEREIAQTVADSRRDAEGNAFDTQSSDAEPEDMEEDSEETPDSQENMLDEPVEDAQAFDDQLNKYNTQDLQTELVKSMREIVSGVISRNGIEEDEDELAADQIIEQSKEEQAVKEPVPPVLKEMGIPVPTAPRIQMPAAKAEAVAGQLSIDDILLSMGERGKAVKEAAAKASAAQKRPQASGVVSAMDEALMNMGVPPHVPEPEEDDTGLDETAAAQDDFDSDENMAAEEEFDEFDENDAVKNDPVTEEKERVRRFRKAEAESRGEEENVKEEDGGWLEEDLASAPTRRIPTEEIAERHASYGIEALEREKAAVQEPKKGRRAAGRQQAEAKQRGGAVKQAEETFRSGAVEQEEETFRNGAVRQAEARQRSGAVEQEEETFGDGAVRQAEAKQRPGAVRQAEARQRSSAVEQAEETFRPDAVEQAEEAFRPDAVEQAEEAFRSGAAQQTKDMSRMPAQEFDKSAEEPEAQSSGAAQTTIDLRSRQQTRGAQANRSRQRAAAPEQIQPNIYGSHPMVKEYQKGLFAGFLGIQNMEEQIASAIEQAGKKGEDRTSKSGNVLILGGHGCGKTTIATGIAKAIAQDRGSQFVKMAKIYASDLNRKDIAATIAKIAGGTLIVEEAGDLEDGIVDQLTTAMEFRTDGLIIILEDEQQYIHELLMRHPRFTMKFTSQIYIPVFTIDELVGFGQIYAGEQDYVFSESAAAALYDRIGNVAAQGDAVSINNVIELVDQAIHKSNKFFRKLTAGKKRFDVNDCIILQEKDFR